MPRPLPSNQAAVLDYVEKHGRANSEEIRVLLQDHMCIARGTMHALIKKGLVKATYAVGVIGAFGNKHRTAKMLVIEKKENQTCRGQ